MPRLFNKIVISFLASLVVLFSFGNFFVAKAQVGPSVPTTNTPTSNSNSQTAPVEGSWYNQGFGQWYGKVYDDKNPSEIFGERYTAAQVQWVVYSLMSFILNAAMGNSSTSQKAVSCFITNSGDVNSCLDSLKSLISIVPGAATVAKSNVPNQNLAQLVFANRPFSGIGYVKERLQKFTLVPEVDAQTTGVGFGFSALEPIQSMWRGVRNLAYGLFVIVSIVLAFMIMFRVKISPQVIISVQSAIPKVIIALILTTFSYAIAGFLVDLMYVVIGFVSLAMSPMLNIGNLNLPPTWIFRFLTVGQFTPENINPGFLGIGLLYIITFVIFFIILLALNLGVVGIFFGAIAVSFITGATSGIVPLILVLLGIVAAMVVIWHFVRIVWKLVKAFAMVLILTIFAPLQISLGVIIPNLGFGTWFKSFVSNLSVFVVTGALALLSFVFLWQGISIALTGIISLNGLMQVIFGSGIAPIFDPGIASASWPPLLGGSSHAMIGLLFLIVSFVIFTAIPKADEIVQAFITGKPFTYGTSIGELTGALGTGGLMYASGAMGRDASSLPWPFNSVPGASKWWQGREQSTRENIAGFLQSFLKQKR